MVGIHDRDFQNREVREQHDVLVQRYQVGVLQCLAQGSGRLAVYGLLELHYRQALQHLGTLQRGFELRLGFIAQVDSGNDPRHQNGQQHVIQRQSGLQSHGLYGIVSTSLPAVLRLSRSRCADATSANGYVRSMRSFSLPASIQFSTSPARHSNSSRVWI